MQTDADVIIAGGGPAGSMAAYFLAEKGIQVILLEKSTFPKYKVCGGGLTHKILNEIPFSLLPVIETTIYAVRFSCNFREVFFRESKDPIMYCTMRGELDNFLLQKAKEMGSAVKMNQQVTKFTEEDNGISVYTKEQVFRTKILIGAEGATGIVARTAGLHAHLNHGMAWEAEIKSDPDDLARYSQTVFLDWGTFPGGYAWIFPKKDHFSIGVGGPASLSKDMLSYYELFQKSLVQDVNSPVIRFSETLSMKAWPIPVRMKKSKFHSGSVLVTGDAAGLGDPLTGEGIFYAIRSGRIAAEVCSDFLSGRTRTLDPYTQQINDELMPELLEAGRIKHIFNAVPRKIHHFVRDNDRAWRAFAKILRGERKYTEVRNGFGKWKHIWGLICYISGIIGKWKEERTKVRRLKAF